MADRKLPSRRNPLLTDLDDDDYRKELIARRRLGTTDLHVDAGQIGTSNATKPKNLGAFDYAHIRVPLPKDLRGSGIFHASRGHSTPEAYFLMRRSSDGYVSASGMFKVAFPWASEAEEQAEKAYLKKLPSTGKEEIAGNIWVPPQTAVELADEYQIRDWILVLLDNAPIMSSSHDPRKEIKSPPPFTLPSRLSTSPAAAAPPAQRTRAKTPTLSNGTSLPPPSEASISPKPKASPRKRTLRSVSPVKAAAPEKETKTPRKIATPKRTAKRGRPAAGSASVEPEDSGAAAPTTTTKSTRKVSSRKTKTEEADDEKVKVSIDSASDAKGDVEETTTRVTVETPARHPSLKLPDDAQAYLDSAKKALDEAKQLTSARKETVRGRKRKAVEITRDDDEDEVVAGSSSSAAAAGRELEEEVPAAKRVRLTEVELRKERIKKRATVGIAAGLAVGALVPVLVSTFFQSL